MKDFKIINDMQPLSAIILRIGIGLVIIWFGLQQVSDPSSWTAYLPAWIKNIPVSDINFVYVNGWFELVFGIFLAMGFYTRVVAFVLAFHLLSIVITLGYNEIGVRDFGLAVALVSIFLYGQSPWSIDELFKRYKKI